ncbi:hypothetical protein ELH23_35335 (plasmid) [Rhizobium ruizarguesonis]|nr:hypothetical protein ELH23_35335 [Rhizobium ruizarguesonis]
MKQREIALQPMSQCCDFSKKWNIGNFCDYLQLGYKDRTGAPYWGCPLPFLPVRSVLSTNLLRVFVPPLRSMNLPRLGGAFFGKSREGDVAHPNLR